MREECGKGWNGMIGGNVWGESRTFTDLEEWKKDLEGGGSVYEGGWRDFRRREDTLGGMEQCKAEGFRKRKEDEGIWKAIGGDLKG